MLMCTSEAKFIINSTIGAICTMIVNNVLFVYCNLRQFLTDIVLLSGIAVERLKLFVAVTVRLMDWTLVNNSLYFSC